MLWLRLAVNSRHRSSLRVWGYCFNNQGSRCRQTREGNDGSIAFNDKHWCRCIDFTHVIFSLGGAPEYPPYEGRDSDVVEPWPQFYLVRDLLSIGTTQIGKSPAIPQSAKGEWWSLIKIPRCKVFMYSIPEWTQSASITPSIERAAKMLPMVESSQPGT